MAKAWKWGESVKLDVLNSKFDAECDKAFAENARPELEEHKANEIWKLTNKHKFKTKAFSGMGLGVYTPKALRAETKVLTETGITGKRDGLRLPAALLSSRTRLSFHGKPPDSYSPFPDYTLKQWNDARLMVASNAFTVGANRVLFNFTSRFNHSCEPNIVRQHKGRTIELITTRPINAGEQLTIQYSAESGHEDQSHFKCSCKRTLAERKKIAKRGREIIEDFERD